MTAAMSFARLEVASRFHRLQDRRTVATAGWEDQAALLYGYGDCPRADGAMTIEKED